MNPQLRIKVLATLSILSFALITPTLAYAAPLANSDKDWQYVNGNSWAWNYSPQTQINKNNVKDLEVKWIFPVGGKVLAPAGIQSLMFNEGANTPPIVRNGMVYITTNWLRTYGVDAKTGKQVWANDYTVDLDEAQKRLPVEFWMITSHLHSTRYWESGDAILVGGMVCDFYGIDAKTGKEKFAAKDLCLDIPGNLYKYRTSANSLANVGTYEKGKQFIYVIPGYMHDTLLGGDARHVTIGVDMNTYKTIWRLYSYPPYDQLSKDWALQECDIGFFQDTPCNDVAAQNRAGLEWDWAFPNERPSKWGGVTANWGQPVVDEDTGILYTQTGNQGPFTNTTMTPGPRLYGSTIMAIDMSKGQRIWWLQPFPRDPYDYDCNWSGILAEIPQLGKVYMKGCKEGILYVMDAKTGKPKYKVDIFEEAYPGKKTYHLTDPFSYYDLRQWDWPEKDGKYHPAGGNYFVLPSWANGAFGTDKSYDPDTVTLYHYAAFYPMLVVKSLPYIEGKSVAETRGTFAANTTIVARDAATGKVKWTWFYPFSNQRAHMVVSGGMIFSGFTDGTMKFFDKDTGTLLNTLNLGAPVMTGVTTGQTADGKQLILVISGMTNLQGPFGGPGYGGGEQVPGTLVGIGLSERAAEVRTTTVATTLTQPVGMPAEVTYAAIAIAVVAIVAAAILTTRRKPSQK